jgi:hypothetical protein
MTPGQPNTTALQCYVIAVPALHAHYVIGQDQDKRRIGTRPNQWREPPLFWSVEFMKEVIHVESNDTAPLGFPLVARAMAPDHSRANASSPQKLHRRSLSQTPEI